MICHSDDSWEREDALLKRAMRNEKVIRYLIVFTLMTLLLALLVFCVARLSSPRKVSQWQHVINNVIREHNTR